MKTQVSRYCKSLIECKNFPQAQSNCAEGCGITCSKPFEARL